MPCAKLFVLQTLFIINQPTFLSASEVWVGSKDARFWVFFPQEWGFWMFVHIYFSVG
jgi:hypothetical protein